MAKRLGPREVVIHPFQHIGVADEGLDAVVPRLGGDGGGITLGLRVTVGEDDVGRRSRSGENEGDKRIGIKGDGAQKGVERLRCSLCRRGCRDSWGGGEGEKLTRLRMQIKGKAQAEQKRAGGFHVVVMLRQA